MKERRETRKEKLSLRSMEVETFSAPSGKKRDEGGQKWEKYEVAESIFRGVSEDYLLRDDFWVDVVYKELFALQEEGSSEEEGMTSVPESVYFLNFFLFLDFSFFFFLLIPSPLVG